MRSSETSDRSPLLAVEGVSRIYRPPGPQRLARLFSHLGGIAPEDFLYGGLEDDEEDEDIDDADDEPVIRGAGTALEDVSFAVFAGEGIGVHGPGGSGKTVLLKIISQVLSPTHGRVVFRGRVAPALAAGGTVMPKSLPLRSALPVTAGMLRVPAREVRRRLPEILEFAEAGDLADRRAGNVSSRRRRELLLAAMLLVPAELIVIETGLPGGPAHQRYREKIAERRREGTAVVMEARRLKDLHGLAERVLSLRAGRLEREETYEAARLRQDREQTQQVSETAP